MARTTAAAALLAAALLAASCGDPPAPAAPPGTPAPVAPSPPPPPRREPLPPPPAGEEARRAGLLRLLEWGDIDQVTFAQDTLAADPDPEAVAAALRRAVDLNFVANTDMVWNALGCVRDARLAVPLRDALLRCLFSTNPIVRRRAVEVLAAHVPGVPPETLAEVATAPLLPVAGAAMAALAARPDRAESAAALRAVLSRVDRSARPGALLVLARLGDAGSVPALGEALRSTDPADRVHAAAGLLLLGREEGLGRPMRAPPARGLAPLREWALGLPLSVPVGSDVEMVLVDRKDPGMLRRLLAQARTAPPETAAIAIQRLLRFAPDEQAVGGILEAMARTEWEVRLEVLAALRGLGRPDALVRTLAALESPDPSLRRAAVLALGRFRDPATVEALARRMAREPEEFLRSKIADALGALGDARGAPALVAMLRSETEAAPELALRAWTARSNLRAGPLADAAAPALLETLRGNPAPGVLANAVRVLGRAPGCPGAREALEGCLSHPNPAVRTQAALAMGDLGDRAARPALAARYGIEPDDGAAEAMRDAVLVLDYGRPH